MKKLLKTLFLGALVVPMASALTIVDLASLDCTELDFPGDAPDPYIYKVNFGGDGEEGDFTDLFSTTWTDLDGDNEPFGADISYTGSLALMITGLYVKGGQDFCFFDINWDGSDVLRIINWDDHSNSAISNIHLTGEFKERVPDTGATLALLGLALSGLGFLRRRLR